MSEYIHPSTLRSGYYFGVIKNHIDPKYPDEEHWILSAPQIRCLKNISWDKYRLFEFFSTDDIDQFKNHYGNFVDSTKLNHDVALFRLLLAIPMINEVSLVYNNTLRIKKEASGDWEEINKEVYKAFYKFLGIPSKESK